MRLTFLDNYPKYDKPAININKEKIAIGEKISSSSPLKVPLAKIPSSNSYPARATIIPAAIIISSTLNPPKSCIK